MKKNLLIFISLLIVVSLTACATKSESSSSSTTSESTTLEPSSVQSSEVSETEVSALIEKKEYALEDLNDEYVLKNDKLNGYYFSKDVHAGNETLLYLDVDEFFVAMDGYLLYENYKFEKTDTTYRIYWTYTDEETNESEDCDMVLDLENDVIKLNLYFGNNTPEMEETDYDYALYEIEEKSYSNDNYVATYSMKEYDIDFFKYGDQYMAPYWVLNLFVNTFNYCNLFFNGDEFIFVYTDLTSLSSEDYTRVKSSSLAGTNQTSEQREDLLNQLFFIFDEVFGVKETENFTSLKEHLSPATLTGLMSKLSSKNNVAYKALCFKDLDDGHTYTVHPGFYSKPDVEFNITASDVGAAFLENNKLYWDLHDDKEAKLGNPGYVRFSGDTAIIDFDGFETAESSEIYNEDGSVKNDAYQKDSFFMFKYCLDKISKNPDIKNIIIDVSLNGGGNVGAMIRVLGYFIKDIYVEEYYKDFDHAVSVCYNVDTNLDGECTDADVYSNYNWYVLTSEYSYSAANAFSIVCKDAGIKLIGQRTGGGMCSILPLCLLDGTSIYTSGFNCTTYYAGRENGEYEFVDVQNGIEVDYEIDYEYFYDDAYLAEFVDGLDN